jgi:hypothetical protein
VLLWGYFKLLFFVDFSGVVCGKLFKYLRFKGRHFFSFVVDSLYQQMIYLQILLFRRYVQWV